METSTLKEIEGGLPKKNNAKYIRALDDDGNPIYISKEDLASVVGGLLPVSTQAKNGLLAKEYSYYKGNYSNGLKIDFSKVNGDKLWNVCCSFDIELYDTGSFNKLIFVTEAKKVDISVVAIGKTDGVKIKLDTDSKILYIAGSTQDSRLTYHLSGYRDYVPTVTMFDYAEFESFSGTNIDPVNILI